MVGYLQPLAHNFAIVTELGYPTEYFIRWAQQKQEDIGEAVSEERALEIVKTFLTEHPLQAGSGIDLTPDGDLNNSPTISAKAQEILDQIATTQGSVLFRGAAGWEALPPGTNTQYLKSGGPAANPLWDTPAGGGGGGGMSKIFATASVNPSSNYSGAASLLGGIIIPASDNVVIEAVAPYMQRESGNSYRVVVLEMASATVSGELLEYTEFSSAVTDPAWKPVVVPLDTPVPLELGKLYFVGVTPADYSAKVINVPYSGTRLTMAPGAPILIGQGGRLSSTFDPAGGQTLAVENDASYCCAVVVSF